MKRVLLQVPPLRFAGRDDNSVAEWALSGEILGLKTNFVIPTEAYPDFLLRSTHQRLRVRLSVKRAA
jgi:hypothetical protein